MQRDDSGMFFLGCEGEWRKNADMLAKIRTIFRMVDFSLGKQGKLPSLLPDPRLSRFALSVHLHVGACHHPWVNMKSSQPSSPITTPTLSPPLHLQPPRILPSICPFLAASAQPHGVNNSTNTLSPGYTSTHEWCSYIFDALVIFPVVTLFIYWHPSKYLPYLGFRLPASAR